MLRPILSLLGFPQIVWDIETYPNCFLFGWEDLNSDAAGMFELSDRLDERAALMDFLGWLFNARAEMFGFNNLGFDYPVLHDVMTDGADASAAMAYAKADKIINGGHDRFVHIIWPDQRYIRQVDLYTVNHFDNVAKATSLKALQFAMRAESIEDLPIAPGTVLTPEQIDTTKSYCAHDVSETKRFVKFNEAELAFRRALVADYGVEALNWSDGKIGRMFIQRALGDDACFIRKRGERRRPRQTERGTIVVSEIIFPYIQFRRPEARAILHQFQEKRISAAKGAIAGMNCEFGSFRFDFGVGGVHGSVSKRIIEADSQHVIIDADVASLYPSIAIENGMYPEHLGPRFTQIYRELRAKRRLTKKKTPENAALKLALNVPYGDSNNAYSPLYDPQYTMQTTINGQLLLLMLAESLFEVPGLELIQINTDGLTFKIPNESQSAAAHACETWEDLTKLPLEYKMYRMIAVRDVNNYLAVDTDGDIKRKGAYDYPREWSDYSGWWNRDYSALVIPMAAEAALVRGVPVEKFIGEHANAFDFMLRAKVPRSSELVFDLGGPWEIRLQRISRYYAALSDLGSKIVKRSPPVEGATVGWFKRKNGIDDATYFGVLRDLPRDDEGKPPWDERIHTKNKSTYDDREMTVHSCALVCNRAAYFDWSALDREWYIGEARKLVDCFK